ncbi:MAG: peptidoglycan bridge formation glycyltransferase FemA/FemB family protein [bacterium]|nr:peptidoglycan bridge formation glycyltransferase FemA/FemB family protein [bacterium]
MLSFLQSKEWLEFQRSLGRDVFEYNKDGIKTSILKYDLPFGKNYLYIPRGPEMNLNSMTGGIKNPIANFVSYIKDLGKQNNSIFIKAEPAQDNVAQLLAESGFKKSDKEIQPKKTVIIEIENDDNELLGRMHHKTRYNIKVAERYGIVVEEKGDIEPFLILLKKTARRDKFHPHPENYYKKLLELNGVKLSVHLFIAEYSGKPSAGAMILVYGDTGYYLHGASDHKMRATMSSHMLHWHIIKFLRSKGLKNYDMWGIDASKWPGVTRFKLGWGGKTIEYPGAFDMAVSKIWYKAYGIIRKIRV